MALGGIAGGGSSTGARAREDDARSSLVPAGVRAVLLDGLGTLVALRPPWGALVEILRERHGLEVRPADARRAFLAEIAHYRAHHLEGRDGETLAQLRARCAEVLARELPPAVGAALPGARLTAAMLGALRFEAYPDAAGALAGLRARGLRLVVVSNWDVSLAATLDGLGLLDGLDDVVTSAEVGEPKPGSAIFQTALARAGVEAMDALHVGDSFALDVCGARAAGVAAVLLSRAIPAGGVLGDARGAPVASARTAFAPHGEPAGSAGASGPDARRVGAPSAPRDGPAESASGSSPDARRARAAGVPVIASLAELLA